MPLDYSEIEKILYDDYKWIADMKDTMSCLEIVNEILTQEDEDEPIYSVTQSSIWAVGMSYKHFKRDGTHLSNQELQYTRNRGGIIGMIFNEDEPRFFTLKKYLEERDPEFYYFNNPQIPRIKGA
jgi:hypothetical protein